MKLKTKNKKEEKGNQKMNMKWEIGERNYLHVPAQLATSVVYAVCWNTFKWRTRLQIRFWCLHGSLINQVIYG